MINNIIELLGISYLISPLREIIAFVFIILFSLYVFDIIRMLISVLVIGNRR